VRPRVSIIIPVKNEERTIEKCLRSLQVLNYPDYEIIVVNDGSTDGTGALLSQFPAVTVITTEGIGPAAARNLALERSNTDYVAFTDGDCIIHPEWLNELLAHFTDATVMGVGGDQLCPADEKPFGKQVHDFLNLLAFSSDYLKTKKSLMPVKHNPTCNMMYRKQAFEIQQGFKQDLWPCEDLEFDYRLITAGYTLIFNPGAIVYHYRPHTLKGFSRMHFRYGRAHAKLVLKYGLMAKIHYIPLVLLGLAVAEGMLIVYNPSLALAALLTFVAVPLAFFGLKKKRLFKAFSYGALFFITIFSWTAGFIRGLMDKNIW
jgi:cellulose synthase/poly-beta-1,6-N-acetylglucosamine synthase-like glycosyltransferase